MKGFNLNTKQYFCVIIDGIEDIMFLKSLTFEPLENLSFGGAAYCGGRITLGFYDADDMKQFYEWFNAVFNHLFSIAARIPGIKFYELRDTKRTGQIRFYNKGRKCVQVINLYSIMPSEINDYENKVTFSYDYSFVQLNP